jgi:hypothetical protein
LCRDFAKTRHDAAVVSGTSDASPFAFAFTVASLSLRFARVRLAHFPSLLNASVISEPIFLGRSSDSLPPIAAHDAENRLNGEL